MGINTHQTDDGGLAFVDDASASEMFKVGGTKNRNVKVAKVAMNGKTATTGGALLSWVNPENAAIIIQRLLVDITTKSTGAANLSIGVGTGATTSYANLIDTYAAGGTEKVVDNHVDGSTLGKLNQKCAVGSYVTATGSADTTGMVSNVYIEYTLV